MRALDKISNTELETEEQVLDEGHALVEVKINLAKLITELYDTLGLAYLLQEAVGVELVLAHCASQQLG